MNKFFITFSRDYLKFLSDISKIFDEYFLKARVDINFFLVIVETKIYHAIEWIEKNKIWLTIILSLIIIFSSIILIQYVKVEKVKNNFLFIRRIKNMEIQHLKNELKTEKNNRRVEIQIIREKVDTMQSYIARIYPGFNYKKIIEDAITNPAKINNIPEELMSLYIHEKWVLPHGIQNYELTLKKCIFPLKEGAFTATINSEYGRPRPYGYYGFLHEGIDLVNPYDNSVLAIYDAIVFKKYYSFEGGWTLEIKFLYEWEDGRQQWCFARFRHMEEIYVNVGDHIKQGDVIAQMGDTGFYSSAKHLHWEIYLFNGKKYVNYNPVQNSTWNNKVKEKLW